ncbi:tRNA (guanosine(37)-N1)-methyltransferase TrmD [Bdellovibrio bacteriovorus]|uniref:tRNA (guanosine(37)-N1)-methyltransferase TrmD n=1 Tax=Bdellovibrio bacteriovorus TaxID=959 RepID=UPI0035A8A266
MLKIDVITLFPEMIESAVSHGVLGQALKGDLLSVNAHTPREFASDRHRTVDDRPFGGGDGMIMLPETLEKTLQKVQHKTSKVVYLSPQGKTLTDETARALSKEEHLVFICGRYGGIDQRIINTYVDEEISIGDYVLSGGELGALVVIDALARFIPGVLGHDDSAHKDSFSEGLLEHPNFTRPREYLEQEVPEVLLSGNHKLIEEWKHKVSALVTLKKRPDLFKEYLQQENEKYQATRKKKTAAPLQELKSFFAQMSAQDKHALGLEDLREEDLNG